MKNHIATLIAIISLIMSTTTLIIQKNSQPLGEGNLDKYSFATPLDAYRSQLQILANNDFLSQLRVLARQNAKKVAEELKTFKIDREKEYGGSKILFIEFEEGGVPKRKVVVLEKDASSGLWSEHFLSTYEVKLHDEALAMEMEVWEQ